jgi:hemerythrin
MKNLEKINWTNDFSIGNIDIDRDHKKLLDIYNDLVDLIESNKNNEEFAEILSKMTDYTLNHFGKEETYMQKFGYPKFTEHRQYHSNFIEKVAIYNFNLLSSNPLDPKEIIKFLVRWLIEHILKSDMDYEKYKKKIQSNATY